MWEKVLIKNEKQAGTRNEKSLWKYNCKNNFLVQIFSCKLTTKMKTDSKYTCFFYM